MKERFEVSTKGMRALQMGRPPWQLAKEIVSNSWDEKTHICKVELRSLTTMTAYFSVYDDGRGFKDIRDAWTLMGHTDKRLNPEVRGRFNIGEKEILSVAKSAKITTAGKIITFPQQGGRTVRTNPKDFKGTLVEVSVPWGSHQVKETEQKLMQLLPPSDITYEVNGLIIPYKHPHKEIEATLETVIQPSIYEALSHTRRKTRVEIYRNPNGVKSQLYEMGIPVQVIDCPYSVNICQKVPLPPNRDTVRDTYLQDVYAAVLNATADEVEEAAANWTRVAIEDKDADPEAVKTIVTKRYGEKVALWSTDPRANEKAMLAGFEIVHGRTLSEREREVFSGIGIQHTSSMFPTSLKSVEPLREDQLTDGMRVIRAYAKRLYRGLFDRSLEVSFISDWEIEAAADFIPHEITFNVARLGRDFFNQIDHRVTETLLHEFAHTDGVGHEPSYYRSLQRLAGRAVHLALEHPELFKEVQS